MLFQEIINDIQFFGCLARDEVGVSLCHGKRLMAHEFFQLKQGHFAGLCQPRCECVPEGVEGDAKMAVSRRITDNLYSPLKCFRYFADGAACASFLKDGSTGFASVRKQHIDNGFRGVYDLAFPAFCGYMQDITTGINVFSVQLEDFSGSQARLQRQQGHVMELWAALCQFFEENFGFLWCKEAQSPVIDLGHLPAALTGDRVDAVPAVGTNGVVNDSAQEAEMMMDALRAHHLAGELVSYRRQHPGCNAGDGNGVNPRTDVFIILLERFIDVFALIACPRNICVYGVADSNGFVDDRVAFGVQFRKELDAGCSGGLHPHALAMASDSFPVQLLERVEVREAVYPVIVSSAWVTLGGDTIVYALELSGDVFALVLCHVEYVRTCRHMGQAFTHFLSIQEKSGYRFHDNRLISFGGTCGGRTCDSLLKRQKI